MITQQNIYNNNILYPTYNDFFCKTSDDRDYSRLIDESRKTTLISNGFADQGSADHRLGNPDVDTPLRRHMQTLNFRMLDTMPRIDIDF